MASAPKPPKTWADQVAQVEALTHPNGVPPRKP